jgi:HPt (histidine-containing phosphotransfer) domain-containing protein
MSRRDLTGAVDFEYLEGYAMNDASLIDEVLGLFREQAELWSRLLDPDGPADTWRDGAHTLKGSALGIGAKDFARVCAEAEAAANESPALRAALLHRLQHALDLALADIAAYRHEQILRGLR